MAVMATKRKEPAAMADTEEQETESETESETKPETKPALGNDADELAKTRDALKKANKEAEATRKRLKEFEDAGKSELERATGAATAAEQRAAEAEMRAMRLEVAADKGLTTKQAARLVGATREELEADADELLEQFGGKPAPPGGRPREALRGGSDPDEEPDETDPRKLADRVGRR